MNVTSKTIMKEVVTLVSEDLVVVEMTKDTYQALVCMIGAMTGNERFNHLRDSVSFDKYKLTTAETEQASRDIGKMFSCRDESLM